MAKETYYNVFGQRKTLADCQAFFGDDFLEKLEDGTVEAEKEIVQTLTNFQEQVQRVLDNTVESKHFASMFQAICYDASYQYKDGNFPMEDMQEVLEGYEITIRKIN